MVLTPELISWLGNVLGRVTSDLPTLINGQNIFWVGNDCWWNSTGNRWPGPRHAPSFRPTDFLICVQNAMSSARISATRALQSSAVRQVGSGVITLLHGPALPAPWRPSDCLSLR